MYKQVVVVRKDIRMGKGKLASQVAHASLEAYKLVKPRVRKAWEKEGGKKVVVKVDSLEELTEIYGKAKDMGIPSVLIRDAGKTQVSLGTITALGLGPDKEEKIDKVTKHLKLL